MIAIVLAFLWIAGIPESKSSAQPELFAGTNEMKIELHLSRRELFVQETTEATVTFENNGSRPVLIPHPGAPGTLVRLRLTELRTGKTTEHNALGMSAKFDPHYLPSPDGAPKESLAPGAKATLEFSLLPWVGTLAPGKYEVRVACEIGEEIVEGDDVAFEVVQGPIRRTVWIPPSSPLVPNWHTIEARETTNGSFELLLQSWKFAPAVHVLRSHRVGTVAEYGSAAASVMPAKMWDQGHRVAWVDGRKLLHAYISEDGEIGKPKSFALPNGRSRLLAPVCQAIAMETPPAGWSAILVQSSGEANALFCLEFQPGGKVAAEHALALPSRAGFGWGRVVYTQEGHRRAAVILHRGESNRLRTLGWPKGESPKSELGSHDWKGRFLAADLALGDDGTAHGVTLTMAREREEDNPQPRATKFTIDPQGALEVGDSIDIEWDPERTLDDGRIAIDRAGSIAALLRDGEGNWHLHRGEPKLERSPLQANAGQPIEIFFPRTGVAVVRFDDGVGRAHFFELSGQELPTW